MKSTFYKPLFWVILLALLTELAYLALYSHIESPILLLIPVSLVASLFYIATCVVLWKKGGDLAPRASLVIIAIGIIYRLSLMPVQPIASGDVYMYIWEGKVLAEGYNPYRYAPADTVLRHLRSPKLPEKDITTMTAIYPPIAECIFAASYTIFGETPYGIKIFSFLAECATMFLLCLILIELRKPPALVALYALCPLPILQFMVDAHVDGFAFPFVALFLFFWLRRKEISSFVALGVGIMVKFLPVLFLPMLILERTKHSKFLLFSIPVVIATICYLPFVLNHGAPFYSLTVYSREWYFNGVFFNAILGFGLSNEISHLIVLGLFAVWLAAVLWLDCQLLEKIYWIVFGFFILSATVHPWYVTWIALLLPLCFRWSGIIYVSMIHIANFVIIDWKAHRIWYQSTELLLLEYIPVLAIAGWEIYRLFRSQNYFTPHLGPKPLRENS